ncbi:MAG: tRNA (adenosine(37)-N6)-dimethylallyltransferase MiaA [Flavobacteriales bacterium]|nr:tRNA (adenosine(37)-N6)-dimethylallyltransferase MiaA [Flavobacteriales bacterium]
MTNSNKKNLIVIAGPTAIGKTSLSIKLAKELKTEIISCDSRQFYKELSIGTAIPSKEELREIEHHFIQNQSIEKRCNIADFEKNAIKKIESLFQRYNNVILVGGSGLYIDAICKGIDFLPDISKEIREKINTQYRKNGLEWLQNKVKKLDPEYFEYVDIKNPQRLMRCLEVYTASTKKISSLHKKKYKKRNFNIIKIGLKIDRESLYKKINIRVDKMIKDGLIDEANHLINYRHYNALNTVGYKELFDFFDGNSNLETAIEKIKQNTRRLAKRQITWFKRDKSINWFTIDEYKAIVKTILQ